jgi:SAM-dependent methyltransferase
MTTTGAQAWVAELYDDYVTATADIPYFLEEAKKTSGPVLELMAGTGRISLPLAEAGVDLTCVDLSGPMLARLRAKLAAKGLSVAAWEMDVAKLDLPERAYPLIILPFQSFAELLEPADQRSALERIAAHLADGGRFICTLHNPRVRRRTIDGQLRLLGTAPLSHREGTLLLWSVQQTEAGGAIVRAGQIYELYDQDGRMEEKRWLDVRFRLVEPSEFRSMAEAAGFRATTLYGDYDRTPFDEEQSPYMIWVLERATSRADS